MEENNRLETNTGSSGSGSILYGTGQQPSEESGSSAVYGAGAQPQGTAPVQLTKPSEPEPSTQGTASVQLTKPSEPQQAPVPPVSGPMQVPPPIQGAPPEKPKKKKGAGLVVGILCAAAVVIVIAIGALAVKSLLGGDPKKQLAKGMANMAKEMAAYQSSVAGDIGLDELNRLKETEPVHTNMDLSFTDPSATGGITSIDLGVDAVTDYKKKMAEFDVSLGTYGIEMQVGNIVAADNTLYVSVPILFHEDVYSLDLTNLGRDFNNSAWSSLIGETLSEDYGITLFGDRTPDSGEADEESELAKILNRHSAVMKDSMKFETIREKREFTFDGTYAEYGGVRVTTDKDAYNELMEAVRDDILASESYRAFMEGYQTAYAGDFEAFREDMDHVIEQIFGVRLEQDLVMDYYLDKKGRIINISTPEDIAVSGQDVEIDFMAVDIDFSGTERALDSIEGGVYLQSGDEILYIGISRAAAITEDYYSENLTLRIQEDSSDDEAVFWYANDWGYTDQTFDLQILLDVPGTSLEFRAEGAYTDIVKGKGYTLRLNHGAITIDGEDFLLMTGSIETEPAENTIEVPENATDVLKMSESDITGLLYGGLMY